jgi:hypothetical protein
MAGKIRSGFELSKQSWSALRQNKQLLIFPLISGVGLLFATVLFIIPEFFAVQPLLDESTAQVPISSWIIAIAIFFVYYLIAALLVIFSNAALIGATEKMIREGDATFMDGIHIAFSKFGKIFVYALISATVGVIARSISQSGRNSDNIIVTIIAAIVGSALAAAWNMVMFFALPVLVIEDVGLKESFHRALALFKQTWGEGFVGSTTISGISVIAWIAVMIVGFGIFFAGIAMNITPLIAVSIVVLVLGSAIIALLTGAVNGIFQTSLYNFATTGDAGPFIDTEMAKTVFHATDKSAKVQA